MFRDDNEGKTVGIHGKKPVSNVCVPKSRKKHIIVLRIFYIVVIPLTHHKNSGDTELKVLGVWCSIILLFTAFLVGVLKG
ncbi:MAG: hypothetical protein E7493_01795 [Ruminococcus albus]|nr:hypothetical protein [Ruminococcus albus]